MRERYSPSPESSLEPVVETFRTLEKNRDYTPLYESARVPAECSPDKYVVFFDPTQTEVALQIEPPHYRTITFENQTIPVAIRGGRGQLTNEVRFAVNVKGVGWLRPSMEGDRTRFHRQERLVKDGATDPKNLGFMTKTEALLALNNSEDLIRNGIDTEIIWNVSSLETIPFRGEHVPITQLIRDNTISNKEYAITIRLLKTNSRLGELQQRPEIIERALSTYKKDMHYNHHRPIENLSPKDIHHEYLEHLMSTLGKNLAHLVNANLIHTQLHGRNITLAGELVDTVSVKSTEPSQWLQSGYDDFRQMVVTAHEFYKDYHRLRLTTETSQTVLYWYSTGFAASLSRTARRAFEQTHGRDLLTLTYDFVRKVAEQKHPPTRRGMQTWEDMTRYLRS